MGRLCYFGLLLLSVGALGGVPLSYTRIVGGSDVIPGEFPYMVTIQETRWDVTTHVCGGVIFNHNHVLTAAHCFDSETDITKLQVVGGEHNLVVAEGNEQSLSVASINTHPDYDSWTLYNDIAILRLNGKFVYNDFVGGVQMPSGQVPPTGECSVVGWGATVEGGNYIDLPMKVSIPIWTDADCRQVYSASDVTDAMICAGLPEGGKDACHDDSGSPLLCPAPDGSLFLAGLMSWGVGCARPDKPSVYTEVSHFLDFIDDNTY